MQKSILLRSFDVTASTTASVAGVVLADRHGRRLPLPLAPPLLLLLLLLLRPLLLRPLLL
jgi:hypothetical protein